MEIIVIVVCLILSAFFSGVEIAFVSSNKVFLGIEKLQDNFYGKILSKLTQKPSRFIAAMLVGNNIALVVYGFYSGNLIMEYLKANNFHYSEFTNLLVQTVISTVIILVTSEFLPKVFFQIYANSLLKFIALPAIIAKSKCAKTQIEMCHFFTNVLKYNSPLIVQPIGYFCHH